MTGCCYHGTNSDFEGGSSKTLANLEHFCTNAFTVALRKIEETQLEQQPSSAVLVCALDFHEAGIYLNAYFAVDLKRLVN